MSGMELSLLFGGGFAYAAGLVLGLIGGGGSILTVPILVYLFQIPAMTATGYSLLVVGITSFFGALSYAKSKLLAFKTAFFFSIPSLIGVLFSRKLFLPSMPDYMTVFGIGFSKDQFVMVLFGGLVLVVSYFMFRSTAAEVSESSPKMNPLYVLVSGLFVGVVTGFVGVGGGFMIVPALVLLTKLPIRSAIATSLLVIAINSLVGVLGDLTEGVQYEWGFLSLFTAATLAGTFSGSFLNRFVSTERLKKGFSYFVVLMGVYILVKELV